MHATVVVIWAVAASRAAAPFAPLDTAVIAAVLVGFILAVLGQRRRADRSRSTADHPSGAGDSHDDRTEPTESAARR